MKHYRHLFFDMDLTIAPSREKILPEMYKILDEMDRDITIVSGQEVSKIGWQSNELIAYTLGQNGNHATDLENNEIWNIPLDDKHRQEILEHINHIISLV
ncbi:hypothetical protein KC723_01605, partial [Candidatus Kaiserbacteria bacterium]|nr:hypothetical protein [Candidatus Kaiserbacteria bacterium]